MLTLLKRNINIKNILWMFLILFLFSNVNNLAFASGSSEGASLDQFICNVFLYLTGKVGKALAAFACVGVSLAFVGGKIAWTTVLVFAIAMACIFGAPQIVKAFSGGDLACEGQSVFSDSTVN